MRTRRPTLGTLAVALGLAASVPGVVLAHGVVRSHVPNTPREARRASPVTVAVGASARDPRARELMAEALQAAVGQHQELRLQTQGTDGASLVVRAHVRSLTVQHDAAGTLAQCDIGVVVADGTGAVRAMLDSHRIVRGGVREDDEAMERSALRGAADGLVRDLVDQMVR